MLVQQPTLKMINEVLHLYEQYKKASDKKSFNPIECELASDKEHYSYKIYDYVRLTMNYKISSSPSAINIAKNFADNYEYTPIYEWQWIRYHGKEGGYSFSDWMTEDTVYEDSIKFKPSKRIRK
jgi:hypothetical protein